jgi:anti-anti-sigma factor
VTEQGRFVAEQRNGIPVIHVSGDVDITNVVDFQNLVRNVAETDSGIVISLEKVNYIDSRMVHELFSMSKRFDQSRRKLVLVWPRSQSARYILETAGVPVAVPFYASIADAIEGLKQ